MTSATYGHGLAGPRGGQAERTRVLKRVTIDTSGVRTGLQHNDVALEPVASGRQRRQVGEAPEPDHRLAVLVMGGTGGRAGVLRTS